MAITADELRLAAALLELASEQFGNHGCNDFALHEYLSTDACEAFSKGFHEWNGDPLEYAPGHARFFPDFCAMSFLAHKLSALADSLPTEAPCTGAA